MSTQSDGIFERHQKLIDKMREMNKQFIKVPCDDMTKYKIEDCKICPHPCEQPDHGVSAGEE